MPRMPENLANHLAQLGITDDQITWEDLDPSSLVVEPDAQRETDPGRVERMAATWTPLLAGALVVAVTETGERAVADGMHRRDSAILADRKTVHCQVIQGLNSRERARLFLALQRERKGVSPETTYRVSLTAGERRETEIQVVLDGRGLRIGGSPSSTTIAAVVGICRVWDSAQTRDDNGGQVLVAHTLDILIDVWGHAEGGDLWQTDLLQGLARLLLANPGLDRQRLIRTLADRKPRVWVADAQQRSRGSGGSGGRPVHMAAVIRDAYNRGLRSVGGHKLR